MSIQIDLNDAIFALSDALDLVGIDEIAHGKRVGYMAFKCAETMGLDKAAKERLFQIGLLHDCGVSSSQVHHHLVTELQWQHDEDHARSGHDLLNQSRLLAEMAPVVRYHHTPWSKLKDIELVADDARFDANLIFLVDRIDALAVPHYNHDLQLQIGSIRDKIRSLSGSLFSPAATEIFLQASASDSFWLMLEPPHLDRFMVDIRARSAEVNIQDQDVKDIARIFARVVDAKSTFTYQHSIGVACLSRFIARQLGCTTATADKIEIAGLLHDLGKLRIPDEILENPGKLNQADTFTMHRHSFETYQVLREVRGFEDIALWAAYHHEKPDGTGYPYKRGGNDLTREARIIAVADIFQALAQERPYRGAMPIKDICNILRNMAINGLLDSEIVEFALVNADDCYAHAVNVD